MKTNIEKLSEVIAELMKENDTLTDQIKSMEGRIEELRASSQTKDILMHGLKVQIECCESLQAATESQLESLQKELQQLKDKQ